MNLKPPGGMAREKLHINAPAATFKVPVVCVQTLVTSLDIDVAPSASLPLPMLATSQTSAKTLWGKVITPRHALLLSVYVGPCSVLFAVL